MQLLHPGTYRGHFLAQCFHPFVQHLSCLVEVGAQFVSPFEMDQEIGIQRRLAEATALGGLQGTLPRAPAWRSCRAALLRRGSRVRLY